MVVLMSAILAVTVAILGLLMLVELRKQRRDAQLLGLLATFAPIAKEARSDPRLLLVHYPAVVAARRCFPEAFAALEEPQSKSFPLGSLEIEEAHARWTAEWLEWEQRHESEYQRKAAVLNAELVNTTDARMPALRAELEAVEQQKLDLYQHRYEEYVGVSRALAKLTEVPEGQRANGDGHNGGKPV